MRENWNIAAAVPGLLIIGAVVGTLADLWSLVPIAGGRR
jgi:hypothetical protein